MTPIRMNRKHMTCPITYYICPLNDKLGYKKCSMGYFVASKIDKQVIKIIEDNIINQQMIQRLENTIHSKLSLKSKVVLNITKISSLPNCLNSKSALKNTKTN